MTAAEHTRIVLSEFRDIGTPFKTAWAAAMRTLPRKQPEYREWKRALYWARPAFEANYNYGEFGVIPDEVLSVLTYLQPTPPVEPVAPSLLLQDTLVK